MHVKKLYELMEAERMLSEKMIEDDRGWLTKNLDALKKKKSEMPATADHSLIDRHIEIHQKAISSIDE